MSTDESSSEQTIIRTKRLVIRLADPSSERDCDELLLIYNDPNAGKGAVSAIKTAADIQEKFRRFGPRPELCTLAPPPRGQFFLIHLPSDHDESGNEDSSSVDEGELVGQVGLSCRPEMPYPDLGYALLGPYEGHGYATEAGLAVLEFWRETIGVREIYVGTAPDNLKSQRLAERLGFVRAGTFDVMFGHPPNERRETGGQAFVLPGMEWVEGRTMMLTVGKEMETPGLYTNSGDGNE